MDKTSKQKPELPDNPSLVSASGSAKGQELRAEIKTAINRCSVEGWSNTPDFILAQFLVDCLNAFDAATARREKWYGYTMHPVDGVVRIEGASPNVRMSDRPQNE